MTTCSSKSQFWATAFGYIDDVKSALNQQTKIEIAERLFDHYFANKQFWTSKLEEVIRLKIDEFATAMPQVVKYKAMLNSDNMDIDE